MPLFFVNSDSKCQLAGSEKLSANVVSGIATRVKTRHTSGEDTDQGRDDSREIGFELGSHCSANNCPRGVELLV